MISRSAFSGLVGGAVLVVVGTAAATPPASVSQHVAIATTAPHQTSPAIATTAHHNVPAIATTAHHHTSPAPPHVSPPSAGDHATSTPAVIHLAPLRIKPHAPPAESAEIHLAPLPPSPQRQLAIAQAHEAASITEASHVPENPERYGTTAEKYRGFVTTALESDPQRYERAIAHLQDPTFGLPVTTNEHGQRVVVVYHGGTIPEGTSFDVSKTSDFGVLGQGVYFTPSESLALEYAGRAAASGRPARVIRIEVPVGDIETAARTKVVAAPLGGVTGRFDGAIILNVSGYDAKTPDTYGAFTDGAYLNHLPHKTVHLVAPAPAETPAQNQARATPPARKGWLSRVFGRGN